MIRLENGRNVEGGAECEGVEQLGVAFVHVRDSDNLDDKGGIYAIG